MADDFDTLFGLAGNRGTPDDWSDHFDPIGLILLIPPKREEYWCTPLNVITFARTGGDGTHYSYLSVAGEPREVQPVIMTVPMSDEPNTIVGESLRDFLALGCRFGYFALEGLVHQRDETLAEIELGRFDVEAGDNEVAMLHTLTSAFGLQPWRNPRARLAELKLRHFSRLQIPAAP